MFSQESSYPELQKHQDKRKTDLILETARDPNNVVTIEEPRQIAANDEISSIKEVDSISQEEIKEHRILLKIQKQTSREQPDYAVGIDFDNVIDLRVSFILNRDVVEQTIQVTDL